MKTTRALTAVLTTSALALAALTGCGNTNSTQAEETTPTPAVTSAEETTSNGQPYLEYSGNPHITEEDLNDPIREAIAEARSIDSPLYIDGEDVFWLQADIPYTERDLVEREARSASGEGTPIRWVDGLGTGTLTFYLYGNKGEPYTLTVEQPSASVSANQE